jgi:hypothetical protein
MMMMKGRKDDDDSKDVVERHVRDKARDAANRLIQDISDKASRDVDARLKFLSPETEAPGSEVSPQSRCGTADLHAGDLQRGAEELFNRYYKLGMSALNRGDAGSAAFYLGKCLLLPVSDELKMRQMVRHNLRLALSLRDRLKKS